jgi:hypothetical protein
MDKYIVTLYEKCKKKWIILTRPMSYTEAKDFWVKKTDNGKRHSRKEHGDYFKIEKIKDNFIVTDYSK